MKLQATILTILMAVQLGAKTRDCGAEIRLTVMGGRPVADCVFVNGAGPYRFLIDTGMEVNSLESDLARMAGLKPAFQVGLVSPVGAVHVPGARNLEVLLGAAQARGQEFLFSELNDIHQLSPDIQGVLGQAFLSHFDYLLDMTNKRLRFGQGEISGTRVPLRIQHGVPAVATSAGTLLLDSGTEKVVFFGVTRADAVRSIRTASGFAPVGLIDGNSLVIDGRNIRYSDAITVPRKIEDVDADGLLPVGLFHAVYVSNSEQYIVLN